MNMQTTVKYTDF